MPRPTLADRRRTARDNLTPDTASTPPAPSADDATASSSAVSAMPTVSPPAASSAVPTVSADTASSAPAASSTLSAVSAPSAAGAGGAGTISVSLTTQQLDDARAAFLADWEHGGPAVTFAAWIQEALRARAARTPAQRATLVVPASGQTRSFRITDDTRTLVEAAVAADCAAGQWISLSAWAAAAITTATEAARQRGPLPAPPERLPGRLPTRSKGDPR